MSFHELKKLCTYILIGLGTTGLTWLLWTFFNYVLQTSVPINPEQSLAFTQFAASFLVIGVSLYLNRKITFRTQARRHKSKWVTAAHYYGVYTLGALLASFCTYLVSRYGPTLPLEVIKLGGLGVNVVINYLGQRFWIFK